ncbi:PEP-CTERM protein-sorting domain-containing protein [Nitrosovibrio sp. Nv6]|nr:PEP-CTERM protein-sorting domain-containing protein [Nitrosovibrio sp. Nv6]
MCTLSVVNKSKSVMNKPGRSKGAVAKNWLRLSNLTLSLLMTGSFSLVAAQAHAQTSSERLSSLLAAIPAGGWVQANTNFFSDAWPTGADAVQAPSHEFPGSIVRAWSSFAWDSGRGDLMLWGGGHANYVGNEMYVWDGATGEWGRGSLASRVDANGFVVDSAAPQSAHTYDNNIYLPVNDMFLTFGGAAASGGAFQETDGTNVSNAGPFLWDPTKADPNKVGGTTGSGWNTTNVAEGGNMWIDRDMQTASHVNGTTAYTTEDGKDVVYLTADTGASGFPPLYRYTLGDVRNGGQDTWEKIGVSWNTVGYQGAATIDTTHNLYIRTASPNSSYTSDLAIWDLDNSNVANPNQNTDVGVNLVNADGSDFRMTGNFGIDYDSAHNTIVLWDGNNGGGTVWSASVVTDENGDIGPDTTWTIYEMESSTPEHPQGNFTTGVLGKWKYDATLGAFIALDEISSTGDGGWDAGVWLYKPAAAIPEPETYALFLAGLGLIGWVARRRRA